MPFTISHTAAVLPFSRWLLRSQLLAAVVIGSMVPDFGMFAPWRVTREATHSAWALLTFALPVGLVSYWIFQFLIKVPLIELLPRGAYGRWHPFDRPADIKSAPQWLRAAGGVVVGALTHLVWDGFTHEGARGIRMIPVLGDPMVEFGGHRLTGTRLLQDVSSVVGLLVIALVLCYALRPAPGASDPVRRLSAPERRRWTIGYLLAAVSFTVVLYMLAHWSLGWGASLAARVVQLGFASVRGSFIAILLVSLLLQLRFGAYR